ncbi:MAG: Rrf2 family transcriptional regulator [Acidobacteriota bacterium]|nr:MAG: Rrf2 family transcriptional regulator [Acidobacteriota bacterium]
MLSLTSEHALRALADLARQGAEKTTLARDLAERADVPSHYLSKILATLRRAGMLTATRGVRGGYSLTRDPAHIFLIEVVRLFDGESAHPQCLFGQGRQCSDAEPCHAHEAWKKVKQAFESFLQEQTIATIAGLDAATVGGEKGRDRTAPDAAR